MPLSEAVRDRVKRSTGRRPDGPIRLLTHLRHFGFSFNPVSFYYCFDTSGEQVETIVSEITNTPWNERYAYVLPREQSVIKAEKLRFQFRKGFHVSPFMPMALQYDWKFSTVNEYLSVHMKNVTEGETLFDAMLLLKRQPINGLTCARALIQFPFMPIKVMSAIYWQALQLFLKRIPFYTHPSKLHQLIQKGAQTAKKL